MSKDVSKELNFAELVIKLKDRAIDVRATLNKIVEVWSYNLADRKPGVAYVDQDGAPVTTLDLACFLQALVERRAVVNLPEYHTRLAATVTEGQSVVSRENRHGRIAGLTSHQKFFSLGIKVDDANVTVQHEDGSEEVGAFRTFQLQDYDGTWHEGWTTIELKPFGLDREVFEQLSNATNTIKFQYMIHPMRWPSFYGKPHLLALLADTRCSDELKYLKAEAKRIREALSLPPPVWPKSDKVGKSKSQQFWAFEADVDGFELSGEYPQYPTTQEGLTLVVQLTKRLTQLQAQLRFQYRATQYSFFKEALCHNIPQDRLLDWLQNGGGQPRIPSWMNGKTWKTGHKLTAGARTYWATLEIQPGLCLRFRVWRESIQVAE